MTRLLALETSGPACSVAAHIDGIWFENTQNVERLHNQVLLSQLQALLREAGVAPRAIEVIAFAAGPGSFTGIRLAAAAAQALALASSARIVPVSSSEALAIAAYGRGLVDAQRPVLVVTRSRRDAYYVSAWDRLAASRPRCVLSDELFQGEQVVLPEACHGWAGVGDLPPWWNSCGGGAFSTGIVTHARVIGEIGLRQHAAGESVDAALGLPIYVAGDHPWKPSQPDVH
jgi:tRNA threonylcarbamoyladenosine biosynthesis protein TsaB